MPRLQQLTTHRACLHHSRHLRPNNIKPDYRQPNHPLSEFSSFGGRYVWYLWVFRVTWWGHYNQPRRDGVKPLHRTLYRESNKHVMNVIEQQITRPARSGEFFEVHPPHKMTLSIIFLPNCAGYVRPSNIFHQFIDLILTATIVSWRQWWGPTQWVAHTWNNTSRTSEWHHAHATLAKWACGQDSKWMGSCQVAYRILGRYE